MFLLLQAKNGVNKTKSRVRGERERARARRNKIKFWKTQTKYDWVTMILHVGRDEG